MIIQIIIITVDWFEVFRCFLRTFCFSVRKCSINVEVVQIKSKNLMRSSWKILSSSFVGRGTRIFIEWNCFRGRTLAQAHITNSTMLELMSTNKKSQLVLFYQPKNDPHLQHELWARKRYEISLCKIQSFKFKPDDSVLSLCRARADMCTRSIHTASRVYWIWGLYIYNTRKSRVCLTLIYPEHWQKTLQNGSKSAGTHVLGLQYSWADG